MRVIRHESGWDIAVDMVFTDQKTATTIAKRIGNAVRVLISDAVDPSMRPAKIADDTGGETTSGKSLATAAGQSSDALAAFRKRYCE